ncbi:nucleotidyltransferase family protein [Muriicola marianensis]|uniref:MobA-like NTP transferase domain-containing protein n=1 Tax=Muriicola marianensis TaxID=1324801 RepID=A0ABQ1QP27_9FLAO|nr:nucleotidyltransferase family protein [Muriicola marianensis]GGD38974.1 hypothetical protein GCM10011361_02650 [Muriicola marianensis]
MKIALLLLAAGASRRMGRPKQLLPWKDTTLLNHAIQTALSCNSDDVIVILGSEAETIQKNLKKGNYKILVHKEWDKGLGSTIGKGVTYLEASDPTTHAVLIMLGDQPLLGSDHLNALIDRFKKEGKGIIATDYGAKLGVPAVFSREYFAELARLQGDSGAGKLIASHADSVIGIPGGRRTADLDSPEDYLSLTQTRLRSDS